MRVTAGGRVVPSDIPPLGTSRYPDNTFKAPLRVTPGNTMSMPTQPSNNSGARIDVVGGQPVIFIGDRMFALPAMNTNTATNFGGSAPMEPVTKSSDPPALNSHGSISGLPFAPPRTSSTSPFTGLDLPTLKAQQALKKQELRTVEQTEVLQASHQNDAWRASMIEKKRCLIVELDALRKSISALEVENASSTQSSSLLGSIGSVPGSTPLPTYVPSVPQAPTQPMYSFQAGGFPTPMMMYPPPYGAFSSFTPAEPAPFVAPQSSQPHSPGSASRRSHAIEIKPPQEGTVRQTLNPKSPTYEPATKSDPPRLAALPTPSPPKMSPWRMQDAPQSNGVHRAVSQKHSFSSVDTTDFFPTNTHEHSSTRLAPGAVDPSPLTNDQAAIPLTPEKHWPASPWNGGHSGRSKNNEPTSKLTSWPEAFGKQRSSPSLRQDATVHNSAVAQQSGPFTGAYGPGQADGNNASLREHTQQRSGTQETWPFSSKAAVHVPTTYQEGFQAGYDHVGMPDNPEVLEGYIEGLRQFLADGHKKGSLAVAIRDYLRGHDSRAPSLRELTAGSMPHDSAISMNFNNAGLPHNFENIRSAKETSLHSKHRDHSYGLRDSAKDVHNTFNNQGYAPRERNVSSMQYPATAGLFPDRMVSGRAFDFGSAENEQERSTLDKDSLVHAEPPHSNGSFARQFSGAQIQNRGYNTSFNNQRFYPTPKEISPGSYGSGPTSMRPLAGHRMSGLDGAMDDLTGLVMETSVNESGPSAGRQSTEAPASANVETEEATASCFKAKGKQKAPASPTKSSSNDRETGVSSPNPSSSPKKSGEHSPTKAKLEHVTNKFRRNKKDDPRTMSPEDKVKRSEKWRARFQQIKRTELAEIEAHRKNSRN